MYNRIEGLQFDSNAAEVRRMPEADNLHRIISVSGVTSSGKDYLLGRSGAGTVLSHGTLIGQALATERDAIRQNGDLAHIRSAVLSTADAVLQAQPAVLNTHIFVKHGGYYMVNLELEQLIRPAFYVAVVGDPQQIFDWRQARNLRGERQSDLESPEEIAFHQNMIVDTLSNLSTLLGSGFVVLHNSPDKTDANAQLLTNLYNSLAH